jgi:hypothetical protein
VLTIKNCPHIRTRRNAKGFRSCPQATGVSLAPLDAARIARGQERLLAREARRLWLEDQWTRHFEAVAGPARALPPSARSRRTKGK